MGTVVKTVIAELLAEKSERRRQFRDGLDGGRVRRSAIDMAAIMFDRAQAVWRDNHIVGGIPYNIKEAFPRISKGRLVSTMRAKGKDEGLIG